jgi:hypothetical protein
MLKGWILRKYVLRSGPFRKGSMPMNMAKTCACAAVRDSEGLCGLGDKLFAFLSRHYPQHLEGI